ncbi:hypothetical protein [Rhodanobacter sp. L36]|uniref:hypothetical protein n=1 Tax=Rhodanobacter sp. L36 TaxID=1747221 RepID=UPI00131B5A2A|nr:hypothetical protein [Rhodanobacter sp. L36]
MRTLLVIVTGIVLLGIFTLAGWLGAPNASAVALATQIFVPAWLIIATANFWIGVNRIGYSLREQLSTLLLVFFVPALFALAVSRFSQ